MAVKTIWNPAEKGLSVSALSLFWINPVAFELKYFQGLEPVVPWNKDMGYGSLIGSGIEGWIKTRTDEGMADYIDRQYKKEIARHDEWDEIGWWTELAYAQTRLFIQQYKNDFDNYDITRAEERIKVTIELPSGREITLAGYLDGSGDDNIFEHKCRSDWNTEKIASEIDMDLQFNFYLLLFYMKFHRLPKILWYQHSRRPSGFAYRGPKKRETETKETFQKRLVKYMEDNVEDHFYQFIARPRMERFERFLNVCLYPKLEQFLDWYDYMTGKEPFKSLLKPEDAQYGDVHYNNLHMMTPYGLFNPYLEGRDEAFRHYAMTGSTLGLRKINR